MAATLIVDGYNAIMASKRGKELMVKELKKAREYIIQAAEKYARGTGFIKRVKVVFDGDDKYRVLDELYVLRRDVQFFSKTDKCDDEIIRMVKSYASYGKVIMASNDNYVRNGCRPYAVLIHTEELFRFSGQKGKKEKKTDSEKVDEKIGKMITVEYKKELGLTDNDFYEKRKKG